MSTGLAQFVSHLDRASVGIKGAEQQGVRAATVAAKEQMIAAAEAVNTPKTINTARGKKGNAWGVRYLWYTTEALPRSVVFYSGAPPYWREQGTKAHDTNPRKKFALKINGLFAMYSHVRGVSARPFWEPTKVEIARQSEPIVRAATDTALIKAGYHH